MAHRAFAAQPGSRHSMETSHISVPELKDFYNVTAELKALVDDMVKMKRNGSAGGHKEHVKQCVVKFAALKCANRTAHDAADKASCEVNDMS